MLAVLSFLSLIIWLVLVFAWGNFWRIWESAADHDSVTAPQEWPRVVAVIGVGNFLGIGEKDVAVTFSSIGVTQLNNERRLVTDTTKDALKEAPAYNANPPRN